MLPHFLSAGKRRVVPAEGAWDGAVRYYFKESWGISMAFFKSVSNLAFPVILSDLRFLQLLAFA